ncbi:MAG: ChaN family lipoprotein [Desulfohalobiaceae bacterium]|nr:ChaN family lipoprotein [Desulfohalobiaceae bacterium]
MLLLIAACTCRVPGSGTSLPQLEKGTLVDRSGEPVARERFLHKAKNAEYILIGETHNNACDHRVQARLIRWLAENGTRAAVGLEMVPSTRQKALERFNAGKIGLKDLPRALNWAETWGHPFSLYKPVFRASREAGYPLYGLNAGPDLLEAVREEGRSALQQFDGKNRTDMFIPPSAEEKEFLDKAFEQHKQFPPYRDQTKAKRERFFLVQALWDSAMAERARQLHSRSGATLIILAGNGHIKRGRGIPRRLLMRDPSSDILTVTGWRGLEHPESEQGDLFFFCPVTYTSRLGFSLKLTPRGGLISEVEPESRAARAGMRSGDLLLAAGDEPFRRLMDLHRAAVRAHEREKPLALCIQRNSTRKEIGIDISQ